VKAAASALLGVALAATPAAAGDLLCDFGSIKVTSKHGRDTAAVCAGDDCVGISLVYSGSLPDKKKAYVFHAGASRYVTMATLTYLLIDTTSGESVIMTTAANVGVPLGFMTGKCSFPESD